MREIIAHTDVLISLVSKNLKIKYAGSFLGILWAFINPLLMTWIVGFVFTQVFKASVPDFYLFILAGMFPWTFFAGALQDAATSVSSNVAVLKQFSFPRVFIPAAVVLTHFVIFGCSLLVLLPFFIMADPAIIFGLPWLLLDMLLLFMFTAGIALMLAAWCVEVRDINHFLGTLLVFWLWLTPVFYAINMVPETYRGWFLLNPMNGYMELFRAVLLGHSAISLNSWLVVLMISLLSLLVGVVVFYRKEAHFLKQI